MISFLAAIALQSAPVLVPPPASELSTADRPVPAPPLASLDDLPIEQAAGPRCGIAFATVSRWQKGGDPRGTGYIDMEAQGGREFFIRTMAGLMEEFELTRDQIQTLAFNEVNKLNNSEGAERIAAMMPACLLMKRSAGL